MSSAHQAKNQCNFDSGLLKQDNRVVYMGSSKSCYPKRFSRCFNKVEKKYIQERQPN